MRGMLMSERMRIREAPPCHADLFQCFRTGLGKLHGETASAQVTPELLAEQDFNIRLVIDHKYQQIHPIPLIRWRDLSSAAGRFESQ